LSSAPVREGLGRGMSAPEVCPAHRYDRPGDPEERVICLLDEHIPGAWGFICSGCWEAMLNAKARREEWEVEE
jgi:hypothetical protein